MQINNDVGELTLRNMAILTLAIFYTRGGLPKQAAEGGTKTEMSF